jgi:hypothetical protein
MLGLQKLPARGDCRTPESSMRALVAMATRRGELTDNGYQLNSWFDLSKTMGSFPT